MSTILVVDDSATNRQFLANFLGDGGHHLLEAANGMEALALAQSQQPELVITDILMPAMDGIELIQALRADPALAATKVIIYTTSYLVQEADALADACGVEFVVSKAAEPQQILDTVKAVLGLLPDTPAGSDQVV